MINEVLHSRAIAFVMGCWTFYCAGISAYDGALFIPMIYGLLLLLNHLDQKKSTRYAKTNAQNK